MRTPSNHDPLHIAPWPVSTVAKFLGGSKILVGRRFSGLDHHAVLGLVGAIFAALPRSKQCITLTIMRDRNQDYHLEIAAVASDLELPAYALPGVNALPSYMKGYFDVYGESSVFIAHFDRDGQFWESSPGIVMFNEEGVEDCVE